jgi:uncharacterized protein (DUF111 family)
MNVLYYDCTLGIKGEWNIGALLNAWVDKSYFLKELEKLKVFHSCSIDFTEKTINGINMDIPKVIVNNELDIENKGKYFYSDLEKIVDAAFLSQLTKEKSKLVIKEIFYGISKIRGIDFYDIEVKNYEAIKYLINVVGNFICLDYIKPSKIMCSKIGVGNGVIVEDSVVKVMPSIVASKLLENKPVSFFSSNVETVDEVGIAILNEIVDEFVEKIDFTIEKTVYGFSSDSYNFLRIYSGNIEDDKKVDVGIERISNIPEKEFIIECNIDDMNSELYEHAMKKLFGAGALDVYFTSIIMKKGRPAIKVSVLCKEKDLEQINKVIFLETNTFGTRSYEVKKDMLQRSFEKLSTEYGEVTIKRGFYEGKLIKAKPEYEECRKIAEKLDIPITEVYYNVIKNIEKL